MQRFVAAAATFLAALAVTPAGLAGTASVNGSTLYFVAGAGEANDLVVLTSPLRVTDAVPITAGAGCAATADPSRVTCDSVGVTSIDFATGDGNDRVNLQYAFMAAVIDGGSGADTLFGSDHHDTVSGGEGNDTISGGLGGNDVLNGQGGNDLLDSVIGGDQLNGGEGDDYLIRAYGGIPVANVLSGGDGIDVAYYGQAYGPLSLTLDGIANDAGLGVGDNIMSDIENVIGGSGDDTIVGDGDANVLDGGPGADSMQGGGGRDTVTYATRTQPVWAELGAASGVQGEADFIGNDIERLIGGSSGDVLIGGAGDEDLLGGGGDDVLDGGLGTDLLDAGAGDGDVVDYSGRLADLAIDLVDEGDDGDPGVGENDTLRGFEEVWSGAGDDQLSGGPADEIFDGGAGADTIAGGGGYDLVDYSIRDGDVFADLDGAAGDDGEDGEADTLAPDLEGIWGGAGDDELGGNDGANTLVGGAGDDLLAGGLGTDELDGGAGFDVADYSTHSGAVVVDIGGPAGNDTEGETVDDSFEGLVGGGGNDILTGDWRANLIHGGPGNDDLRGVDGDDELRGGTGADLLGGGFGYDLADYGERLAGITADPDGQPDDGEPGEGDNIAADIEDLGGGDGNDTLIGNGAENFLFGRGGNDSLDGGLDSDFLDGGDGNDNLASRDDLFDENDCGPGAGDKAVIDWFDDVVGCEQAVGPAPHAATGGASAITQTTARLSAVVNPLWNATSVHWEYGTTTAYGMQTANVSLPANAVPTTVSTTISGLSPGAIYHFRVVATNGGGSTFGADLTFTTLAAPSPPPPPPPPSPPPPPPVRCVVAKVVGQRLAIARTKITRGRCRVGKVTRRPSRVVRKGIVLAQKPRAGRRLPRGSKVSLVVSSGKPRKRSTRR